MTRVSCEYESCDYNAEGECMKYDIFLIDNKGEMNCLIGYWVNNGR